MRAITQMQFSLVPPVPIALPFYTARPSTVISTYEYEARIWENLLSPNQIFGSFSEYFISWEEGMGGGFLSTNFLKLKCGTKEIVSRDEYFFWGVQKVKPVLFVWTLMVFQNI
jgi:hypothetical protein